MGLLKKIYINLQGEKKEIESLLNFFLMRKVRTLNSTQSGIRQLHIKLGPSSPHVLF